MYRLDSIRKRYGSNVALDIEELTIAEGRLYTLTGANGAGKSTLLSILAFLAPPSSWSRTTRSNRAGSTANRSCWKKGRSQHRIRRLRNRRRLIYVPN